MRTRKDVDTLNGLMRIVVFSFVAWLALPLAGFSADDADEEAQKPSEGASADESSATPEKELFRGQVVMLRDALEERGVASYDEHEGQVVLETTDGELIPIVSDWRGRAFYQDERLRNREVELVGYRRPGVPYLQVLMVFTFDEQGQRQYTDYWCDICFIPMYEIKPCDCCQGDIRLRFQTRELPDYLDLPTEGATTPADAGGTP